MRTLVALFKPIVVLVIVVLKPIREREREYVKMKANSSICSRAPSYHY